MDTLERIKMIMKMNQLNAASFADKIGVQRSNVSHVLTGRNKPSLDFIEKILIHFPKVNASWLISGQIQQTDLVASPKETATEGMVKKIEVEEEVTNVKPVPSSKKVVKIITFYEDFTFDEYRPNN